MGILLSTNGAPTRFNHGVTYVTSSTETNNVGMILLTPCCAIECVTGVGVSEPANVHSTAQNKCQTNRRPSDFLLI
jgi:hypothetical protein